MAERPGDATSITSGEPSRVNIPLSPYGDRPSITLQNAARDNREDVVRQHLLRLPKYNKAHVLNQTDAKGYTAMHYAAKFNRFKIMTLLVTSGASTELETEEEGLTPLHFSARYTPRYYDEDTQQQESTSQEVEVTTLSTSKQATNFLVTFCRVDVNVQAKYGTSPLHLACQRGNLVAVEVLLGNENIDVTKADDNKDTPLHEAALNGFTEILELILKKMKKDGGITLQLFNDEQHTPLHLACREGHIDVVKLILQYGFQQRKELVNAADNELNTPLHLACESGKDEIVRLLLLNGASLLSRKADNVFPIHIAAKFGYVKVVETMLASGENVVDLGDIYQRTPLHYAAQFNQEKMIDFLLDKGADIEAADTSSCSPLMTAARSGQVLALKTLRHRGADIDTLDDNGKSCVFLAAEANHVPVLRAVMRDKTGAKLALTPDSNYSTPLHIAAAKGHLASLRVLLETSHNLGKLDSMNELGKTPLHLAATNGHPHIVREIILKRPETVIDEDEDGNTPLHLACIHGYPNVAKALIGAKADIEARNAKLWTPLDCASAKGHAQLVSLLINAGADVDPTDKLKVTPLQLASQEGHFNVVNILLEKNANAGQTDQNGFNALDHAIQNGHDQIAMAIVQSSQWMHALRNTTESQFGGTTTPLRKLIRKMPEVAEEVFNRCTFTNATKDGRIRSDSKEYCVTFNYEFLEDFRNAESRASRWSRNIRRTLRYSVVDEDGSDAPSDVPDVAKFKGQTLDRQGHEDTFFKTKQGYTTTWGPVGFKKSKHPLSIMVESERTDLLTHPLVTSLLNYKWRRYGLWVYTLDLSLYAIFLIALTCFALLVPNPLTQHCMNCENATIRENLSLEFQTNVFLHSGPAAMDNENLFRFVYATGLITIISACYLLLKELYQFLQLWLLYINVYNMLEITLYCSALILGFTIVRAETQCLCPLRIQYEFGAIAVFLAWINLILYIKKLPFLGIYVIMFENILITFGKMMILTLLLVFAFGLSLFMAFYSPEEMTASFSTPLRALFKTATMTTGEFEYDSLFRQNPGGLSQGDMPLPPLQFEALARVLWLVFLVFMPIILVNLLVGLAVDDIKGIQEAAALKRLELQVELVLNLESKIPPLRRWFTIKEDTTYPNKTNTVTKYWKTEAASEKISNALNPQPMPIEDVQSHTRSLVREMGKMKETLEDLAERNTLLERIIKQMAIKQGIDTEDTEDVTDEGQEEPSISTI